MSQPAELLVAVPPPATLGFIAAGPWDLIGHAEVAETKIKTVEAAARDNGFPLRLSMEPEEG